MISLQSKLEGLLNEIEKKASCSCAECRESEPVKKLITALLVADKALENCSNVDILSVSEKRDYANRARARLHEIFEVKK